ncbi:MAG: hypothetical protein Q8K75_01420 [Chlamydiales bacterium]|nr:hypothetical protein [Chlamydiales bacterium]
MEDYGSYGNNNDPFRRENTSRNNLIPTSTLQLSVLLEKMKTLETQNLQLMRENKQLSQDLLAFQHENRAMFNVIIGAMNLSLNSPGKETRTYPDGIYSGEVKGGRRHGIGTFESFNGDRYKGVWEDDCIRKGTLEDADGNFDGEFDSKGQTSRGLFTYKDNSWFKGSWWGHKERWIGTFCDGIVKMKGTYNPVSGKKNSFHGNVTCTWVDESNGCVSYKGGWHLGKPDGQGAYTMICKNGISHTWRGPWVYTKTPPSPPENNNNNG